MSTESRKPPQSTPPSPSPKDESAPSNFSKPDSVLPATRLPSPPSRQVQLVQQPTDNLIPEQLQIMERGLAFLSPIELAAAFQVEGWTPNTEIQELVMLARQDKNPTVKLGAIKALRKIMTDTLKSSGMLQKVVQRVQGETPNGERIAETRVYDAISTLRNLHDSVSPTRAHPHPGRDDGKPT